MERKATQLRKRLAKKAKQGYRGYPIGTIAYYGPDDRRASKLVASVVGFEGAEPEMRKWLSDVRDSREVAEQLIAFFAEHGVRSTVLMDRIFGCPHEEGIDYEGPVCPHCPFWANRDRYTGEMIG